MLRKTLKHHLQSWLGSVQAQRSSIRTRFLQELAQQPILPGLDYSFDQPLAGDGWHTREHQGNLYWRFTGPTSTASLYLPRISAPRGELVLTIAHSVSPIHVDALQASYNGFALERCRTEPPRLCFSLPPEALSRHPYTCIALTTPPTVQPYGDSRRLGVAVQRIEVY